MGVKLSYGFGFIFFFLFTLFITFLSAPLGDESMPNIGLLVPWEQMFPLKVFLTYETEFVLNLAVLENSVLPMGWDSSHATLK